MLVEKARDMGMTRVRMLQVLAEHDRVQRATFGWSLRRRISHWLFMRRLRRILGEAGY